MTREEHLKFCRICKNQKFDPNHGIVCGLTNIPAAFEVSCDYFSEDVALKSKLESTALANNVSSKVASQGKRFANCILDLVFLMIFSFIFGIVLGIFLAIFAPDFLDIFDEDSRTFNYIFGFIVSIIYYTSLEFFTGRTIAKFITRTRVVTEDGEKPGLWTIFIRSLCRFIPFEGFSFLGSDSSGLHDKLSKTKVVNT